MRSNWVSLWLPQFNCISDDIFIFSSHFMKFSRNADCTWCHASFTRLNMNILRRQTADYLRNHCYIHCWALIQHLVLILPFFQVQQQLPLHTTCVSTDTFAKTANSPLSPNIVHCQSVRWDDMGWEHQLWLLLPVNENCSGNIASLQNWILLTTDS